MPPGEPAPVSRTHDICQRRGTLLIRPYASGVHHNDNLAGNYSLSQYQLHRADTAGITPTEPSLEYMADPEGVGPFSLGFGDRSSPGVVAVKRQNLTIAGRVSMIKLCVEVTTLNRIR